MRIADVGAVAHALKAQTARVIVGQDGAIDLLLVALLGQGHVLLEGVPGTGKTLLARVFATGLGLDFRRIQFTPDLMPGDILGTNLFDFRTGEFRLTRGPVFTQVLLADEINRTPPKTQAALLQAMQERAVSIDGTQHELGEDFLVLATQNPIEHEGTYPLPEAQLDRFLLRIRIGYPGLQAERTMARTLGTRAGSVRLDELGLATITDAAGLAAMRAAVAELRLAEEVVDYAVDITRATREDGALLAGASPRATNMLCVAARASAALDGRDYVLPDDVKRLAIPVLAHRLVVAPDAELEGLDAATVLEGLLERVPAPR